MADQVSSTEAPQSGIFLEPYQIIYRPDRKSVV